MRHHCHQKHDFRTTLNGAVTMAIMKAVEILGDLQHRRSQLYIVFVAAGLPGLFMVPKGSE